MIFLNYHWASSSTITDQIYAY